MLGLGTYDSDSDSDKTPKAKSQSGTLFASPPSPTHVKLGGGATLAVIKTKAVAKASSLLHYDESDSDEEVGAHLLGINTSLNTAGAIDIISSPSNRGGEDGRDSERAISACRMMMLLPPEPSGLADPRVDEKIRKYLKLPTSFNLSLQGSKKFHNPYILEKIAGMYNIDQNASNYPPELYDPNEWMREDYLRIANDYKRRADQKAAAPQGPPAGGEISGAAVGAAAVANLRRKSSKWDMLQNTVKAVSGINKAVGQKKQKLADSRSSDDITQQRMRARRVANQLSESLGVNPLGLPDASSGGGRGEREQREATARLAVVQSQKVKPNN